MSVKIKYKVVQDADMALEVLYKASKWLEEMGKATQYWHSKDMNRESMFKHAEESEFYAILVDGKPAGAMILQDNQRNQSWESVDKGARVNAMYVHWIAVAPEYRGTGLPKALLGFAEKLAVESGFHLLRLDTNADEPKLMKIYDDVGFERVQIEQEGSHRTAFYEKKI